MSATEASLHRPTQPIDSQLAVFIRYCEAETGMQFAAYTDFETFTMSQFRVFWLLFLQWSGITYDGDATQVCAGDDCETAVFFPNLHLNYAENLLAGRDDDAIALVQCHDNDLHLTFTRQSLRDMVVTFASFLRNHGIQPGDRVAVIARNNWQVIVAALGSAAIGAVFTSCAHDMGTATILSRFAKLAPKILVANCVNQPGDMGVPLEQRINEVIAGLPSLTHVVTIDGAPFAQVPVHRFIDVIMLRPDPDFVWQRFPFNHPLFIMFSSGTTGVPKCIMHGAGGTLIEHLKEHRLHGDLTAADRLFFQTSCGWMMWNWSLSALACGATVILYDGPLKGPETLWELVSLTKTTVFGTNPAYLQFTETAGYQPNVLELSALRSILSTGSILYPHQFDWIAEAVKPVMVQSISGGTDMIGCFVLGNPLLPVHRGKAQCRSLGLDTRSLPPDMAIGELICANPFPSRPIGFFGELDDTRYHNAYYAQNPGVWTHGDLVEITSEGITMHGRSDGVINIRGVRIGPADIYRILQTMPPIIDAMAVEQTDETEPGGARLILLVVLRQGVPLDAAFIARIRKLLVEQGNAMMVPAMVIQVDALPVTFSGKQSEAAARDAVNGREIRNRAALKNPECLDVVVGKARPILSFGDLDPATDLEASLCRLCERYINVTAISPTDDFLALGADSLAILGFLIAATEMVQTTVALPSLIGVSTIRGLTNVMNGTSRPISSKYSYIAPQIRKVEPRDEPEILRLLDRGFQRRLRWQRIFEHPWQPETVPRGYVITSTKGGIVGFLGLIAAQRTINGKSDIVANLTSWYVDPDYRGWSNRLLAEATSGAITYTSLTPSRTSRRILGAIGFETLTESKLYSLPLMHLTTLRTCTQARLIFDPVKIRDHLNEADRAMLDDHSRYECTPVLVMGASEMAFALIGRRHYRPYNYPMWRYSEVLYCTNPGMLHRHLERITLAIARRQATIGLTFTTTEPLPRSKTVPAKTMFRSGCFGANEIDFLYSELTLLPV